MKWWEETPSVLSDDYEGIYGINDAITHSEVSFLIDETSISPHASVLDLCCGTGRHSIRLAELGYEVTGLDLSSEFLRVADEKSLEKNLSIDWVNKDMREIPFDDKFDLIFIMFGAWGFFAEDHENYAVFEEIQQALKANGHFVLDFFNRDWIVRNFQPVHWVERELGYYLEKRQFDIQSGRLDTKSVFIKRDGTTLEWETSIRAFTLQEIRNRLQQVGFSIIGVYGDLDKRAFDLNTPPIALACPKKGFRGGP